MASITLGTLIGGPPRTYAEEGEHLLMWADKALPEGEIWAIEDQFDRDWVNHTGMVSIKTQMCQIARTPMLMYVSLLAISKQKIK